MSPNATARGAAAPFDDPEYIDALRSQMQRFARLQLGGDDALAEDAVQEALLGALQNAAAFRGRAAFRTWVFGILKHKIADLLRQRGRLVPSAALGGDETADPGEELFDDTGRWVPASRPAGWSQPEAAFGEQQFWRVFELCLDALPPNQGRVFMMREFLGLDAAEICKTTGLTQTNLYVLLHRARLRLRECLGNRWFKGEG